MKHAHFAATLMVLLVLGAGAGFVLGLSAGETANHLLALTLLFCAWHLLKAGDGLTPRSDAAIGGDLATALGGLVGHNGVRFPSGEWRRAMLALIAGGVVFAVLLVKTKGEFLAIWPFDQVWHQAMIDYDALWRTPIATIPGNILYQFDIRLPVSTHAMPVLGLSTLAPPAWRVAAGDGLLFAGMLALFFTIGATFGLRPLARAILAGIVALIAVVPAGLEWLFWLVPPNFFTTQRVMATWWGEAPMLMLATAVAFYWIGQGRDWLRNALAGFFFAAGVALAVIGYPAGAVYFVPIIAVYCAVFLFTSRGRTEWGWKLAVAAVVGVAALLLRVPQFFSLLYGYTFGSYFFDYFEAPTMALIHDTFAIVVRGFDWRRVLFFFGGMAMAAVLVRRGPRPVARFALAVLVCEAVIIAVSLINALFFRAPMLFSYAETAHGALWAAFFILLVMAAGIVIDNNLGARAATAGATLQRVLQRRRPLFVAALAGIICVYALAAPSPPLIVYPPAKPPMVDALAQELALKPGAPFRGRSLTLYTPDGDTDIYAIALRYRRSLGNDFLEELLPFGIPTVNQGQHWTSPVTFAFLQHFFGTPGDAFDKNFFWLNRFNERIARLTGVRMVISDGDIAGATLMAEQAVGARRLRLYRLDEVNLGQYAPTRPRRIARAAEAIAVLEAAGFDPKRDVVVEHDLPPDLMPAGPVSVTTEAGPRLHVRASSPGRSLLVLPFEFSHCLELLGTPGVRLVPVNLQQTGLLFEREADVTLDYRYGFGRDGCRAADLARARALELRAIVPPPGR